MKQDLLTFKDWSHTDLTALLQLALKIKQNPASYNQALKGKSIVALFEKPSLRTRVSFDIGIQKLGGHMLYLDSQAGKLAGREAIKDMGANLACWADAIVARVYKHSTLEQLATAAKVPVINGLCDLYHPCQALADYLTLHEQCGDLSKVTLAYLGDGNNVCHSLLLVGAALGVKVVVITPPGHEVDETLLAYAKDKAKHTGSQILTSPDLHAAEGADVLYTDTWLSMGDDTPLDQIKDTFMPYQVNEYMMQLTGARYVMHCQPAHRGLEISSSLVDSSQSLMLQQAENRMHGQNAILTQLLS